MRWGRLAVALLLLIVLPGLGAAQGYDKSRGRPEVKKSDAKIRLQLERVSLGFGSFFDREDVTFSTDALYGAVQLHGVGLPFVREGTSTGVMLEGHVTKLFSKELAGGRRLQTLGQVDWRLWSTTRVPLSAMPVRALQSGTPSRMFAGTDLLLAEGGPDDLTGGFDARFVIGGDLGMLGPGNLVVEIYSFEKDRPIAFALFYGF